MMNQGKRIQLRGTCGACGNQHAVRRGALAAHGYTRPYEGWGNVGTCWGAGHAPHEVSPEVAEMFLRHLTESLEKSEKRLERLRAGEVTSVMVVERNQWRGVKKDKTTQARWGRIIADETTRVQNTIYYTRLDQERVKGVLKDWAPAPLTEVPIEAKTAPRVTLSEEERERLVPVRGTGYYKLDRGRGILVLVDADKARVLGQARGLGAFMRLVDRRP